MARMPATKPWSSADFNIVIARVTPDLLALLGDGVPGEGVGLLEKRVGMHPA
jgi:hypothetical protein